MEVGKQSPKEFADVNIQLAEKKCGDHLPDMVLKENGEADDGADEKLVNEDGPLKTNNDASEVKFLSIDSQNGDAKIDVENVKIAFAGMGKEELMKFANDPFWVRLRWFLFIFFWLLWIAMLAGAVTIIIMAPKCASPAPLKWWEQSPLYQVFLPAFKDGDESGDGIGDLKGLLSELDYIKDLGVKGLSLSSVLKVTTDGSEEAVEDFKDIDPRYGTLAEFEALVTTVKSMGLHLVLSFVPNHSSRRHPWFVKSESNDTQYKDYYIWSSDPPKYDSEDKPEPPNNWKSVRGGSVWEWSEKRKAFYLHQFGVDEPDLNFTNPAVVEEFKEIFMFWLNLGVSGLQLEKVEYLLEDPSRQDEVPRAPPGTTHDEYDFYNHARTVNQPGIENILAEWKKVILNYTDGTKMLTIVGNVLVESLMVQKGNNSHVLVDLLQANKGFHQLKNGFDASDLSKATEKYLEKLPNNTRPTWQLTPPLSSRVASRLSSDFVDALNMIVMLLPGTPITLYGEEIGMEDASGSSDPPARCVMSWSNATNAGFSDDADPAYPTSKNYETVNVKAQANTAGSSLSVYKELVEARNAPSIMYGTSELAVIGNDTVFAFTRIKSGNPGYLVAFNTADREVTVSFDKLNHVPEELNVLIKSSNFNISGIKAKSKLNRDSVQLSARGALVATFVPKLE